MLLADKRKMEESEARQKVFNIPEVVEILISFHDPVSILHLVQSPMMVNKETLQKSLSSKAWTSVDVVRVVIKRFHAENLEDGGAIGEEGWHLLARAFKQRQPCGILDRILVSRQALAEARQTDIKDMSRTAAFSVFDSSGYFYFLDFGNSHLDSEPAWARLKQMTADEFAAAIVEMRRKREEEEEEEMRRKRGEEEEEEMRRKREEEEEEEMRGRGGEKRRRRP